MHTTTLPIQVSAASANAAVRQPQASTDAGQFSASLSREMALRQNASPAPAAIAPVQKARSADKPAAASHAPAAREVAKQVADSRAPKTETASEAPADAEEAEAVESTPMADMLALVASFNQLQNAPAAEAPPALPVATAEQFAALQASTRPLAADNAEAALGAATLAGADVQDATGARALALASGEQQAHAQQDTGFRAAQDAASAAAATRADPDTGLAARQAREAIDAASLKDSAPVAPAVLQAQPAALDMAHAVTSAATDRIAARVGTPAWNQQLSQKIVWMVGGEEQTASLTLNPPDLGPMQVVLSISNDQTSVAFSSNQLEVRQALENALPRLREMMSESGIALGNATVDAGMPDGREAQQQQAARGHGGAARGGADGGAADSGALPVARSRPIGDQGMVDTFA